LTVSGTYYVSGSAELGTQVLKADTLHMPSDVPFPVEGWPENDEGCWRGLISSAEVNLEIVKPEDQVGRGYDSDAARHTSPPGGEAAP
jgi:hypothetical protein